MEDRLRVSKGVFSASILNNPHENMQVPSEHRCACHTRRDTLVGLSQLKKFISELIYTTDS